MDYLPVPVNSVDHDPSSLHHDPSKEAEHTPFLSPPGHELISQMHQGSIPATVFMLIKGTIGAGVLSLASHAAGVGLLFTLLALPVGAVLTVISINMVGEACMQTDCWSYEDTCDKLFHPSVSFLTGFVQACNSLGSASAYLIVCSQIFGVLCNVGTEGQQLFLVLVGLMVCLPLSLANDINFLRYFSLVSVASLLFLLIAVISLFGQHGPDESILTHNMWLPQESTTYFTIMNCLNTIVFAFNSHSIVPKLVQEMKPKGVEHLTTATLHAEAFVLAFYCLLAFFGVLTFGVGARQQATIVMGMQVYPRSALVVVALVAVLFSVILCFEFHIHPIRQFFSYNIRRLRGFATGGNDHDVAFYGLSTTRRIDIACTIVIVLLSIWIAVALNNVRSILSFLGAFACAYLSYIIPPLWIICIHRKSTGASFLSCRMLVCVALLILGVFFFIFGTYAAMFPEAPPDV